MGDNHKYRLRSALPPGMPAGEFIRQAERAHRALMSGEVWPAERLFPPDVVADLAALRRAEVNPGSKLAVCPDRAGLERRKRECRVSGWWPVVKDRLLRVDGSPRMVAIFDADAVALARAGHQEMLHMAAGFGLTDGVNWAGRGPATNAVRISKLTARPSQLVAAMHYRPDQHQAACTVAPVAGPNGLAGFIDLVSPAWAVSDEMQVLVSDVAQDIGAGIRDSYRAGLRQLRQWAHEHLDTRRYADGALVTDRAGWVAWACRWEHDEKIPAPEGGFRIGRHDVAGLGRIALEPAPWGGWLVRRPAPGEDRPTVRVTLDLRHPGQGSGQGPRQGPGRAPGQDEDAGRIRVSGPAVTFEHALTTGKAEILLILAELGGRTYSQLKDDLYAPFDQRAASTIRSRWCRLRETFGNILACGEDLHAFGRQVTAPVVLYPPASRDLLPGSTAPAVERLRRQH
jgi:hypothetical protein